VRKRVSWVTGGGEKTSEWVTGGGEKTSEVRPREIKWRRRERRMVVVVG